MTLAGAETQAIEAVGVDGPGRHRRPCQARTRSRPSTGRSGYQGQILDKAYTVGQWQNGLLPRRERRGPHGLLCRSR